MTVIENQLFFIPMLTGSIFVIAGFVMLKFPPKKINGLYGYRTKSSMKNQERWDFAQNYSAKEMMKLGFVLALTGLFGFLFEPQEMVGMIIGLGLMILMVILLIVRVESAIKKKFEENQI